LKNSRLSSTKRRWFTAGAVGATTIPCKFDDSLLSFRRHDRPSAANKKKYGEIGSPWRSPREGLNSSGRSPLKRTEKVTEVTNLITI